MLRRIWGYAAFGLLVVSPVFCQRSPEGRQQIPIQTWQAPAFWDSSTAQRAEPEKGGHRIERAMTSNAPAAASGSALTGAIAFTGVVPCRLVDTRGTTGESGAFGPPIMGAGQTRTIPVPGSARCNIPSSALAYSLNFTVVPTGNLSYLSAWPTGNPPSPPVSILNSFTGIVVANAAVVPAGNNGSIDVFVTDQTQVIIDINGYYAAGDSSGNLVFGAGALANNTTGYYNTAVGTYALQNNSSGGANTAVGRQALQSNTVGMSNTAMGGGALGANTTGNQNTAVGAGALQVNTTGNFNAALGQGALETNTTGASNTAIGTQTLLNNTTGSSNTASGVSALFANTTGNDNTASGRSALFANTTGYVNTASGSGALVSNTTGYGNTANGFGALSGNNTGNNNIAIGYYTATNVSGGNSNNIHIGNPGNPADTGTIRIGTSIPVCNTCGTQTSFFAAGIRGVTTGNANAVPVVIDSNGQLGTVSSSARFKEDIHDMAESSNGLLQLRPVTFRFKRPGADGSRPVDYGLIAEEVAQVFPDLVVYDADGQIETVQYQKLTPMLINELQKEHKQLQDARKLIRNLENRIKALEGKNAESENAR